MPRPLVHYTTSTPPSPFTGTPPVPTDRATIGELTALRDAVRAGRSAWTGSGLTATTATGHARQHRDRRIAARAAAAATAPAATPTPPVRPRPVPPAPTLVRPALPGPRRCRCAPA